MIQVVVDEALQAKLHHFSEPVELCDSAGRVLGRVFPAEELTQYEPLGPQLSKEELERAQAPGKKA